MAHWLRAWLSRLSYWRPGFEPRCHLRVSFREIALFLSSGDPVIGGLVELNWNHHIDVNPFSAGIVFICQILTSVIKTLWTFFGPWSRARSQSPPCWIFGVKQIHQSTASERTTRLAVSVPFTPVLCLSTWAVLRPSTLPLGHGSPPQRSLHPCTVLVHLGSVLRPSTLPLGHGGFPQRALYPCIVLVHLGSVLRPSTLPLCHGGSPQRALHPCIVLVHLGSVLRPSTLPLCHGGSPQRALHPCIVLVHLGSALRPSTLPLCHGGSPQRALHPCMC